MKVYIKPLTRDKWHGKTGKDDFSRPKVIEVLVDRETGRYATGLTEEETKNYGQRMGVDLSDTFVPGEAHPYWSTKAAMISLPNHTIILDDTRDTDFIKIKNLKASSDVANSMEESEEGKWPNATHVIYDENEETKIKASRLGLRNKCILVASKLTLADKVNLVRLLSKKSVKGRSQDFIDVEVDSIIENNPEEFERYTRMDKAEFTTRATILEGLSDHVLVKDGASILYMGEVIGASMEDTVKFFLNPDNQTTKVAILSRINAR